MISKDSFLLREKRVSGIGILADPKRFLKFLTSSLHDKKIEDVKLNYIRYKPGMNFLAGYLLQVDGKIIEAYAKAFGDDKNIKIQKYKTKKSIKGPLGNGRIFFEDKGIMVGVFPNDNKIKYLKFLDGKKSQKIILKETFSGLPEAWDGKIQTLNYKPERRYIGKIKSKNDFDGVIRIYDKRAYQKAKTNSKKLRSTKLVRIPRLLGHNDAKFVLGYEWLDGKVLNEMIFEKQKRVLKSVKDTGRALADFHSKKVNGLAKIIPEKESADLFEKSTLLSFLYPHLKDKIERLAKWFDSKLCQEISISSPIHGDFNGSQIIIQNGGNIGFIDFDGASLGDPRMDVGTFLAHLHFESIMGRIPKDNLPKLREAFLHGYQTKKNQKLPAIDFFIAASLFKLSHQPFRDYHPDWENKIEQIFEVVECFRKENNKNNQKLISIESDKKSSDFSSSYLEKKDPDMPLLQFALNKKTMEREFVNLLQKRGINKVRLMQVQPVRYKPCNRCLIKYVIKTEYDKGLEKKAVLYGKTHAKGLDKTAYRLQKKLWSSGFDSKCSDRISVPQPIGTIPEVDVWLQKKVSGFTSIKGLLGKNGHRLACRIAEAIYKVHKANIPSHRKHTIEKEIQILEERLGEVAQKKPSLDQRINAILDSCRHLAKMLPETEPRGIHRDFYHDQVIVNGDHIYLIDFDLYCKGDPSLDVGNFIGHLKEFSLRKFGNSEGMASIEEAFLERFLELSGNKRRLSVQIYTTLTLVRHIFISQQFSDRKDNTLPLISLCEKRLKNQLEKADNLVELNPAASV